MAIKVSHNLFSDTGKFFKLLVRFAYLVRGVVYLAIGWFAMRAAFIGFHDTKGTEDFFHILVGEEYYGKILLMIIAGGLTCYSLWKGIEAFKLFKNDTSLPKKIFGIGANISLSVVYATLSITAFELIMGLNSSDNYTQEEFISDILHWQFGKWLILAAGMGVILFSCKQFYSMATRNFQKKFNKIEMSDHERRGMLITGILGYGVRGIVHGIIGYFLVRAALTFDPDKAVGIREALSMLSHQSYGPYILGGTAVGLMCYGVFSMLMAWHKRIYL